ncbi:hypothetical protein SO694_0001132 [Aureococcus anophagefferens]|uniref:Uncharacterized protein n=1 Tax=Aureococcus anophagefferens TaxID=44056 RepID=A0ABR1GEP2_AURAN
MQQPSPGHERLGGLGLLAGHVLVRRLAPGVDAVLAAAARVERAADEPRARERLGGTRVRHAQLQRLLARPISARFG